MAADMYDLAIIEDDDSCTPSELEQYFQYEYKIHDETSVVYTEDYILRLAKDDSLTCLAAGLSDGSVRLFDINSERGLYITAPHSEEFGNKPFSICGVRFLDETPNLLLVGTTNGIVRLIDLRTQTEVARFQHYETDAEKTVLCFDRNSNSQVLCTGTAGKNGSVFMFFYDIRKRKKPHSYYLSHNDDVTTLKFHPLNPNLLGSGSTDGLINIFDIKEKSEDNALLTTINTESSVDKINWHKNEFHKDVISCITHTNDFKLYESEGDLISEFKRDIITKNIKRKSATNCNLIDCHSTADGGIVLLTGSNLNNGEILRSLRLQNKQLLPLSNLHGNKQIVRESILDKNSNVLITGGECGIVTLWIPKIWNLPLVNSDSSKLKIKTEKSNKITPY